MLQHSGFWYYSLFWAWRRHSGPHEMSSPKSLNVAGMIWVGKIETWTWEPRGMSKSKEPIAARLSSVCHIITKWKKEHHLQMTRLLESRYYKARNMSAKFLRLQTQTIRRLDMLQVVTKLLGEPSLSQHLFSPCVSIIYASESSSTLLRCGRWPLLSAHAIIHQEQGGISVTRVTV